MDWNQAFLTETGEEKRRLYEEAVRLRRELSAQNRAVHLPWLARALDLLATQLAATGRLGPALDAGHEAVELARDQPFRVPALPRLPAARTGKAAGRGGAAGGRDRPRGGGCRHLPGGPVEIHVDRRASRNGPEKLRCGGRPLTLRSRHGDP
ncbi:hypothetical protein Adi01nite_26150 [Amorphoplanes digitatis]|nr:hypothetical protein Adi01nite_26150 [Actinoplanes digitatis]